jgi:transposase
VALEHGVNANLVFKWRKAKLDRKRSPQRTQQPALLPVCVDPPASLLAAPELDKAERKEGSA